MGGGRQEWGRGGGKVGKDLPLKKSISHTKSFLIANGPTLMLSFNIPLPHKLHKIPPSPQLHHKKIQHFSMNPLTAKYIQRVYSIFQYLLVATHHAYTYLIIHPCTCATPTHTNTHQHTPTHNNTHQHTPTHNNTHQHTTTHTNTQQHTPTHNNTHQHTSTHTNTHQHTPHCTSPLGGALHCL